ncbi:glycosyltransferase [Glaciimonas sp. GNP009]
MIRVAVICNESPYPPIHGGRVDVMRRLRAFHNQGVKISQLITWGKDVDVANQHLALSENLGTVVDEFTIFEISRGWLSRLKRLPRLLLNSLYVVTREVTASQLDRLFKAAQIANVNAVFLDGLFGGQLALALAKRLGVPLFYRSHNIEHLYLQQQSQVAKSLRGKIVHWLASRNIESFERRIIAQSALVFDISIEDMTYWKFQDFDNLVWLPPFCDPLPRSVRQFKKRDVAFLGNLFMPNNVQGVRWLLESVWPLVLQKAAGATLRVAGSNPADEIIQACAKSPNVELVSNVEVVSDVYDAALVMVNPVLVGSGVNMKALELLDTGKPVISTSQGVKGLPIAHKALFQLADSPSIFASAILKALENNHDQTAQSRLPECYRPEAIVHVIRMIAAVILSWKSSDVLADSRIENQRK